MNWQSIEANYDVKMNQAETALADIKENKEASEKSKLVNEIRRLKASIQAEIAASIKLETTNA
jgi:hypothetical protein